MKVLHLPYGSPMIDLCRALRAKGIEATACHFDENRFDFKPDICLKLNSLSKLQREQNIKNYLKESMNKYDIFHFHFGETFLPDKSDLNLLKQTGKQMVVHHHGSDIRLMSIAKRNNPYVRNKAGWTDEKIHKNLSLLSKYIDHAFVQDHELEAYIENYYKHIHVVPHTIDVNQFKPQYPNPQKQTPLIVHAPTSRDLKGTEDILKAINRLKRSGFSIDFQLIEGKSYNETLNILANSDIVIDQLRIGASGYISSEAMALGKTVVCYIREDLLEKYPPDFPIVNATPDTITTVLSNLLKNPTKWEEHGKRGRRYIEQNHNSQIVADRYIDIYNNL